MADSSMLDALIIGGGPAGLSAALGLARLLHTAIVFDSGTYRNAPSKHMHAVATWDHRDPADFRASVRKDLLARYSTIGFADVAVDSVEKAKNGFFKVTDVNGKGWFGKTVLLASGVHDVYPDIPGYSDCWGKGIYHCLYCHGYEDRGAASAGILAIDALKVVPMVLHMTLQAKQLASGITIYTNGDEDLANTFRAAVTKPYIQIDSRSIKQLIKGPEKGEMIIDFIDGTRKTEGFLVGKPNTKLNGPFVKQLGVELSGPSEVKVTPPFNSTSVRGVFAAGDLSTPMYAVNVALTSGSLASVGIAAQVEAEA